MGHFLGPFSPYLGKTEFSSRFCSYQFFLILTKSQCQISKKNKLMSAFQATLISVPLKPIVRNGDNQKNRENPFPAKPTSQKFCPLFHNYQLLGTSSQAVPLCARGQRWSQIHLTSPLFSSINKSMLGTYCIPCSLTISPPQWDTLNP